MLVQVNRAEPHLPGGSLFDRFFGVRLSTSRLGPRGFLGPPALPPPTCLGTYAVGGRPLLCPQLSESFLRLQHNHKSVPSERGSTRRSEIRIILLALILDVAGRESRRLPPRVPYRSRSQHFAASRVFTGCGQTGRSSSPRLLTRRGLTRSLVSWSGTGARRTSRSRRVRLRREYWRSPQTHNSGRRLAGFG